jgi:hypothetical protein
MLIKKFEARTKGNSDSCIVHEYPFNNKVIGFAVAEINGRFPETGFSVNEVCLEIYYVM